MGDIPIVSMNVHNLDGTTKPLEEAVFVIPDGQGRGFSVLYGGVIGVQKWGESEGLYHPYATGTMAHVWDIDYKLLSHSEVIDDLVRGYTMVLRMTSEVDGPSLPPISVIQVTNPFGITADMLCMPLTRAYKLLFDEAWRKEIWEWHDFFERKMYSSEEYSTEGFANGKPRTIYFTFHESDPTGIVERVRQHTHPNSTPKPFSFSSSQD